MTLTNDSSRNWPGGRLESQASRKMAPRAISPARRSQDNAGEPFDRVTVVNQRETQASGWLPERAAGALEDQHHTAGGGG
jgi:hypothetical protein